MDKREGNVWRICVRNRNTYLVTTAIAIFIAIVFSLSIPNTFISQEVLIVESSAPMNLLVGADQFTQAILGKSQTSPIANDPFAYKKVFHSGQVIDYVKKTMVKDSNDKIETKVIVVQYEDEDKNVSSPITNALVSILNNYFTDLNLRRNQPDMDYYRARRIEAGQAYKESMEKYSAYQDSHMGTDSHSEQTQMEFLRNDMNSKYNEYSEASVMYKRAEMFTRQQQLVSTRIQTSQTFSSKGAAMWMASISVSLFLAIIGTSWYILLKAKYGKNR